MNATARRFILTRHVRAQMDNPPQEGWDHQTLVFPNTIDKIKYGIGQLEETQAGNPHAQVYLCFNTPVRPSYIKDIYGDQTLHIEVARGNHTQCKDYCSKEESRIDGPWEIGNEDAVGQGAR